MTTPFRPHPQVHATTLWVERTAPVAGASTFEEQHVEVRVFETQPALVTCKAGRTINVGNYESIRLDVGITLPVYPEEAQEGLEKASEMVGSFLAKEEAMLKSGLATAGTP
jgi:hypothetical protein